MTTRRPSPARSIDRAGAWFCVAFGASWCALGAWLVARTLDGALGEVLLFVGSFLLLSGATAAAVIAGEP